MRTLSILLTCLGLVVAAVPEPSPPAKKPDAPKVADPSWEGIYAAWGKDGESLYTGTVTVKRVGGEHVVVWAVFTEKGHYTFFGAALLKGDTLSVGWSMGDMKGVHVMRRTADGAEGTWVSVPGKGQRQVEGWRFLGKLPNVSEH